MKLIFTAFLILSFLGVAVFGFLATSHGDSHGHVGCIVAMARGVTCSNERDGMSLVDFHIGTLKSFAVATFGDNWADALSLPFALLLFGVAIIQNLRPESRSFSLPVNRQLTHWLALHENSPSFA